MDTLSIADRVRMLCDRSGLKPKPFSRFCGLAPSHMGMILGGDVETPAIPTLRRIAEACGVSEPWLVYGVGRDPTKAVLADLEGRATAWAEANKANPDEVA